MPEGPEIRKSADQVEKAIIGLPARHIFFGLPRLKEHEAMLEGQVVTDVETRGKAMLIHFANGLSVYSHNQLYGRWMIRKAGNIPRTGRQLRFAIHNDTHSALLYSASEIAVLARTQLHKHPFLRKLGPDIMSAGKAVLLKQYGNPAFRRRRLGMLLLDQGFIAGTGNYLRSEILFRAGLHPDTKAGACAAEQLQALAAATHALAHQSYRHNGITNDLQLARKLKAAGHKRREYRHWVFSRQGQPCHVCDSPIEKTVVAGRRLYLCPSCQQRDGQ